MAETRDRRVDDPDDRVAGEAFARLVGIMRRLREPDGCPWDREQSFSTLRRYTLFLSQIGAEEGSFEVVDAIEAINDKLVRRHPHVFGDGRADDADAVLRNWEAIKRQERGVGSLLDDVPRALPALDRAQKLGKRAAQMSFDWASIPDVVAKAREEFDELVSALEKDDAQSIQEELGDLLLTLANVARHLGHSAEVALNDASRKFERRFRQVEAAVGEKRIRATPDDLEAEWQRIKRREHRG